MTDTGRMHTRSPAWLLAVAALGVAWNAFGIVQLVDFVTQTRASLAMKGMTPSAADLYYGLPAWMKLVFAVGSVGGLVGSIALVTRRLPAVPILLASLAGYVALWAGDLAHGVFDVIPGQMAVLSAVVAVAVALLGTALLARRQGIVR
jgi:hypothetical protein